MKKELHVKGMSCNHCVAHVKEALLEVKGVKNVDVNLSEEKVIVEGIDILDVDMKSAVEGAGYDVEEIETI